MSQSVKAKWFAIKVLLACEFVSVAAGYRVWYKMNRDQEYRRWMYDNYPNILEGFYQCAEMGGYYEGRRDDYKVWNIDLEQ